MQTVYQCMIHKSRNVVLDSTYLDGKMKIKKVISPFIKKLERISWFRFSIITIVGITLFSIFFCLLFLLLGLTFYDSFVMSVASFLNGQILSQKNYDGIEQFVQILSLIESIFGFVFLGVFIAVFISRLNKKNKPRFAGKCALRNDGKIEIRFIVYPRVPLLNTHFSVSFRHHTKKEINHDGSLISTLILDPIGSAQIQFYYDLTVTFPEIIFDPSSQKWKEIIGTLDIIADAYDPDTETNCLAFFRYVLPRDGRSGHFRSAVKNESPDGQIESIIPEYIEMIDED